PDGRRPLEAVDLEVLPGELALPAVGHRLTLREVLVAPGEHGAVQPASCGAIPPGRVGKLLAAPGCVGLRVFVGDLDNGVPVAPVDRRPRPARLLPVRARDVLPPGAVVVEGHGAARPAA